MANEVSFKIKLLLDGKQQVIEATTSVEQLQNMLENAKSEATRTREALISFNQAVEAVRNITTATQDLVNNLADLTQSSRDFEDAMRRTNTLAGKDESGFNQMLNQVNELSKSLPIARDKLANGLYAVISSDLPEDNWMQMLEQSTKAAIGGQADLERVVSATATVIKNYGMAWEEAGSIQDKIQNTAKVGETTFEEMAAALPRVTASAATLGITLDELMGSFATLTGVSGNTAEVATQLMSVLTALIKPSSEAINLAQQMGIQFDAAAVKAAGGFANFLQQLDADIANFSAQSGMLREEIYGKLFGNAEALRALIPLTGELKDKFNENVSDMANTAGTLDAAVEQMAQTSEAKSQLMRNQWSAFGDTLHAAIGDILPVANGALSAITTLSTTIITATFAYNTLKSSTIAATIATKAHTVAASAWNTVARFVTGQNTAIAASATAATTGLTAMQMALRGLLVATGVGAAIAALCVGLQSLIQYLSQSTADSEQLQKQLQQLTPSTEKHNEAISNCTDSIKANIAALEQDIATLKTFKGNQQQEEQMVRTLNERYGESMGYFSSIADWYSALTANAKAYCNQLVIQARLQALATETAQLQENVRKIKYNDDGSLRLYNTEKSSSLANRIARIGAGAGAGASAAAGTTPKANAKSDLDRANEALRKNNAQIRANRREMELLLAQNSDMPVTGNKIKPQTTISNTNTNTNTNTNKNTNTTPIQSDNNDIIKDNAKNYADLEHNLRIYDKQLRETDATELDTIDTLMAKKNATKAQMEAIENLWNNYQAGDEYQEPEQVIDTDINKLNTISALNQAISALDERQQNASANEITNIERQIQAIEKKREAYQALKDIPSIEQQSAELDGLSGNELKLKLQLIGLDEVQNNINSLQNALNDSSLNLNADDNKSIMQNLQQWKQYERILKKQKVNFSQVYSSVKGVGNGIGQLTSALKSDGSAWNKITGIIDGAISTYQSIEQLITLITGVTKAKTAAQAADTIQTQTSAAVDTAATATEVANSSAKAVAAGVETTADVASASAKVMKAHASIPWVGVAIGAAMVAALIATMLSIPKFADGGIAYGPTLGLFGEYAGAASNPEVVAPLDRLRNLLGVNNDMVTADSVRFRIKGADLEAILKRRANLIQRS